MNEREIKSLLLEVRCQLDRNGLLIDLDRDSQGLPKADIDAIRLTIEREEKIYPLLSVA